MSASAPSTQQTDTPREFAPRTSFKVLYLFTTFPKLTETFLQREVRAMRQLPVDLELFSLWGGEARFEGLTVHRFSKIRLVALLWLLPYWVARKPAAFFALLKSLVGWPMPSWKNLGETLLGISFAATHAAIISKQGRRPDLIHGVWATMPATAAQMLAKLTGIPFTMGAHAYDLFQNGGDWLLPGKLREAALIVTSTQMGREELLKRGADAGKVMVVRRGLHPFPPLGAPRSPRVPLRVLSVARLVEKKGIFTQLEVFAEMKRRALSFEARLVGDGPLARASRIRADSLGLAKNVVFLGNLPYAEVLEQYAWADVFVFTGRVAKDGDRDGFPNVILEAMATGTPVVASKLGGISELVEDGRNGVLISETGPDSWMRAFVRFQDDDVYYERVCHQGRATVEEHSDARRTAKALLAHFAVVLETCN